MGRASDRHNIIRDASFFSGSTYISQAMFFIKGFLNAKFLGPALYGVWSALNIILKYGSYAHLGALNGMNREIPYQNGRCSAEGMDSARNATFAFCFLTSIVFSFTLVIIAFLLRQRIPLNQALGLITIAFLVFISSFYEFYKTSLICVKKFMLISKGNVIFSVLSVILTLSLVPRLAIYGVYIVAVSVPFLTLVYFWVKNPCSLRFQLDFKEIGRLIKIGFPIMSINFLYGSVITVAGIIVLTLLGAESMGYFSLAMLAGRFLMYFPSSIHSAFEPHIYGKYGENNNITDLRKYLFKPTLVMSLLFPVLLVFYYTGVSFFIRHFLPKYSISTYPFLIILISVFFVAFSPTAAPFLTALNKQRLLVPVYLMGIAIVATSSLLFINMGFGITAVTLGILLAFFFTETVIFIYALNHYIKNIFKCFAYLGVLHLPLLYMVTVLILIETRVPHSPALFPDSLNLALKLAVLSIFSLPMIFIAHNKTGIISDILRMRPRYA